MSADYTGSGGERPPVIADDDLYSRDVAELGLAYGEGPIKGLYDNSAKSIKVAGTDLQDDDGAFNFEDFVISIHQGYVDDTAVKYVLGGEGSLLSTNAIGKLLVGESKQITIPAGSIEGLTTIEIRFLIDELYFKNRYGDVYQGVLGLEIEYQVGENSSVRYLRSEHTDYATLGVYNPLYFGDLYDNRGNLVLSVDSPYRYSFEDKIALSKQYLIKGKATQAYIHEVAIPVEPNPTEDVSIKITLMTPMFLTDYNTVGSVRDRELYGPHYVAEYDLNQSISVQSVSLTGKNNVQYPNLFMAQVVAEMTDRFTSLPDISLDILGLIIDVPVNYNSETHGYSGFWNGMSFKKAWSDNPVWILRYLIMSKAHGIAKTRPAVQVDELQFYAAAQYCDQLVTGPDGELSQRRYTYNDTISEVREADELLSYIAGSFNATVHQEAGVYKILLDQPRVPEAYFLPENVTEDGFNYAFSDLSTRYNDMTVIFANAENNFEEDRRRVFNQSSIDKYGVITNEFQAVGCTSLSEAMRKAFFRMLTNQREVTTISFSTPRAGLYLSLYDHIQIADRDMLWGEHGRILSYSEGELTLRDSLSIPTGTYKCTIMADEGKLEINVAFNTLHKHTLLVLDIIPPSYTVEGDTFTWNSEVTGYPQFTVNDNIFMLESDAIGHSQVFRVTAMAAAEDNLEMYRVEAMLVYEPKYELADTVLGTDGADGITVNVVNTSGGINPSKVPPMPNVTVTGGTYILNLANQPVIRLTINNPSGVNHWLISWTVQGVTTSVTSYSPYYEIPCTEDNRYATYQIEVTAVTGYGIHSRTAKINYTGSEGFMFDLPPVTGLVANYTNQTRVVDIHWNDPKIAVISGYEVVVEGVSYFTTELSLSLELLGLDLGTYEVRVYAQEDDVSSSQFAQEFFDVTQIVLDAPESGRIYLSDTSNPAEVLAEWSEVVSPYFQDYYVVSYASDEPALDTFDNPDEDLSLGLDRTTVYELQIKTRSIHGLLSNNSLHLVLNTTEAQLPLNLTASYDLNTSVVSVSWTPVGAFNTYRIELLTTPVLTNDVAGSSTTFSVVPDLAIGTYEVRAYPITDGVVSTEYSSTTFDVASVRYAAPQNGTMVLNRTTDPDQIVVSWDSVASASAYKVTLNHSGSSETITTTDLTSAFDHLTGAETATANIWSLNAEGIQSGSPLALSLVIVDMLPPEGLTATYDDDYRVLTVTWEGLPPAEPEFYEIKFFDSTNTAITAKFVHSRDVPEGVVFIRNFNLNLTAGNYSITVGLKGFPTSTQTFTVLTTTFAMYQTSTAFSNPDSYNTPVTILGTVKVVEVFNAEPASATYRYRCKVSGSYQAWRTYDEDSLEYGVNLFGLGVTYPENTTMIQVEQNLSGTITTRDYAFATPPLTYTITVPEDAYIATRISSTEVNLALVDTFLKDTFTPPIVSRTPAIYELQEHVSYYTQFLNYGSGVGRLVLLGITQDLEYPDSPYTDQDRNYTGSPSGNLAYAYGYLQFGVFYMVMSGGKNTDLSEYT